MVVALAVVDLAVAAGLLWSVPQARRNREAVITVAAVLLDCGGWLMAIALA